MNETRAGFLTHLLREGRKVFVANRPDPMLVRVDDPDARTGETGFETASVGRVDFAALREAVERLGTRALRGPEPELYVVKKRPGAPFEDRIGVGRARNTDVSLPCSSVSKFHAYFERDADTGVWTLTDAGSTNGTFVEELRVTARATVSLDDGRRIGFGRSRFVFYTAEGFVDWLEGLTR